MLYGAMSTQYLFFESAILSVKKKSATVSKNIGTRQEITVLSLKQDWRDLLKLSSMESIFIQARLYS